MGEVFMQYLVEGNRGPLPASPADAIKVLEGIVIPHFEHVMKLERDKVILGGGLPVGDRAFVMIIEADDNDEADRIVRHLPAWPALEWKGTPLQRGASRAGMGGKGVETLKSQQR